ncbi:MAG: hypothetical protein SXV54_15615 [Chloroflexota bacterium]|nr:hypothetical protein [Chloroflexota bacterium]
MKPKPRKRKRRARRPARRPTQPSSLSPWLRQEGETVYVESSVGTFVLHTDVPQYSKYLLFRPDHAETVTEFKARREAGEQIDFQEEWRRTARFAELNLATDEDGFLAELYLDRDNVHEDEVEEIVAGVCDILVRIDVGPNGGTWACFG